MHVSQLHCLFALKTFWRATEKTPCTTICLTVLWFFYRHPLKVYSKKHTLMPVLTNGESSQWIQTKIQLCELRDLCGSPIVRCSVWCALRCVRRAVHQSKSNLSSNERQHGRNFALLVPLWSFREREIERSSNGCNLLNYVLVLQTLTVWHLVLCCQVKSHIATLCKQIFSKYLNSL